MDKLGMVSGVLNIEKGIAMTFRVAHNNPGAFSLGQAYEFYAAYGRLGGKPECLQKLLQSKTAMVRIRALSEGMFNPTIQEIAKMLLEDDFITPEELSETFGFEYSKHQLKTLQKKFPDERTLLYLRENGFVLMPSPPRKMNLRDVHKLNEGLFHDFRYGNQWKPSSEESFSESAFVKAATWLAVRKSRFMNVPLETLAHQKIIMRSDNGNNYVPDIVELTYVITAYRKHTGHLMCHRDQFVTSTVTDDGRFVTGRFIYYREPLGFQILYGPDGEGDECRSYVAAVAHQI